MEAMYREITSSASDVVFHLCNASPTATRRVKAALRALPLTALMQSTASGMSASANSSDGSSSWRRIDVRQRSRGACDEGEVADKEDRRLLRSSGNAPVRKVLTAGLGPLHSSSSSLYDFFCSFWSFDSTRDIVSLYRISIRDVSM